jgi:hypothetical protein
MDAGDSMRSCACWRRTSLSRLTPAPTAGTCCPKRPARPSCCTVTLDLRHADADQLAALEAAGIPATMLFTPSIGGISHTRDEDTSEADRVCTLERFAALALELAGAEPAVC